MHVSHLRDTKVGVGWRGNTHTLIKTNTLDACIVICAPPPHTHFGIGICTTQHTAQDVTGGEGGPRGRTQAPHKHPLSVKLSAPPPSFHVVVWVVGPLLVLPKVREGIPFLFAGVPVFFSQCGCQEVGTR